MESSSQAEKEMRLTLTARMLTGFGLVIIVLAAMMLIALLGLARVSDAANHMDNAMSGRLEAYKLKVSLWDARVWVVRTQLDQNEAAQNNLRDALAATRKQEEESRKVMPESLMQEYEAFAKTLETYSTGAEEYLAEAAAGRYDNAQGIIDSKLKANATDAVAAFDKLDAKGNELDTAASKTAVDSERLARYSTWIVSIMALLVAVTAALVLLNTIRRPLAVLAEAARAMAGGDFAFAVKDVSVKDEIGAMTGAFIEMKNNTRNLIEQVALAATNVASSSEELAAGADETGKAIQQVTMTIQEVAKGSQSTMTNIGGAQQNVSQTAKAIEGVSRDIEDVAAYATQAAAQGNEGKKSADDAVTIINHAAGTVQNTTHVVQALGEKTKQIGEFISIITGIADQTNLLALNAAIEAARAGDAGRGFAVVAEEVRKLAEESNGAAGHITKLVRAIEGEMATALSAMEKSNEEVTSGAKTVGQASSMLAEIVKGVEALNGRVQGISAAAEEINASTGEVVHAMQSVAAVAEESAAASEEVSSAAEEQTASMEEISAAAGTLARLAQDLQSLISKFKV